jgi:hypothetical protein
MNILQRRDSHDWFVCMSVSCIVHLVALIVIAVVVVSLTDTRKSPLTVQVLPVELPPELVKLDSVRIERSSDQEAVWAPVPLPRTSSSVEIGRPWDHFDLASATAPAGGGTGSEVREASFFGTSSQGDYFVYILDVSPSMNARRGMRLVRAVEELLRSIAQLREDQNFYVIVFGWQTRQMFDDRSPHPECVPATLQNKQRLRDWLARVSTISGTDPRRSLRVSLQMMPSAIFLLSDGQFNKPKHSPHFGSPGPDAIDIVHSTADGRTPINAIAFENPASAPAMAEIAAATGGDHRYVPPPEAAPGRRRSTLDRVSSRYRKAVREFSFGGEDRARPRRVHVTLSGASK